MFWIWNNWKLQSRRRKSMDKKKWRSFPMIIYNLLSCSHSLVIWMGCGQRWYIWWTVLATEGSQIVNINLCFSFQGFICLKNLHGSWIWLGVCLFLGVCRVPETCFHYCQEVSASVSVKWQAFLHCDFFCLNSSMYLLLPLRLFYNRSLLKITL